MAITVFHFQVDILGGRVKSELSAETDISWPDFQQRIGAYLGNNYELVYKVTGDNGKGSYLKNGNDFKTAIERLSKSI